MKSNISSNIKATMPKVAIKADAALTIMPTTRRTAQTINANFTSGLI